MFLFSNSCGKVTNPTPLQSLPADWRCGELSFAMTSYKYRSKCFCLLWGEFFLCLVLETRVERWWIQHNYRVSLLIGGENSHLPQLDENMCFCHLWGERLFCLVWVARVGKGRIQSLLNDWWLGELICRDEMRICFSWGEFLLSGISDSCEKVTRPAPQHTHSLPNWWLGELSSAATRWKYKLLCFIYRIFFFPISSACDEMTDPTPSQRLLAELWVGETFIWRDLKRKCNWSFWYEWKFFFSLPLSLSILYL